MVRGREVIFEVGVRGGQGGGLADKNEVNGMIPVK
jgi:hypothetical protein